MAGWGAGGQKNKLSYFIRQYVFLLGIRVSSRVIQFAVFLISRGTNVKTLGEEEFVDKFVFFISKLKIEICPISNGIRNRARFTDVFLI